MEKVGEFGDGVSEDVDDCELRSAYPMAGESRESRIRSSSCFLAASTRFGSCKSLNSRGIVEDGKNDCRWEKVIGAQSWLQC